MTDRDFQAVGSSLIVQTPNVILADDMGLGKSKEFLDAVRHVARKSPRPGVAVLVVCKATNVETWLDEIKKFDPEGLGLAFYGTAKARQRARAQFAEMAATQVCYLVTSYETMRIEIAALAAMTFDWVALDEAHKVKSSPMNGAQSLVASAIHRLQGRRKVVITGTLFINSAADSWNVCRWLGVEQRTWPQFAEETLILREVELSPWRKVLKVRGHKPSGLVKLTAQLAPVLIRRKKHDVLDLPPKVYQTVRVRLNADEERRYRAAEQDYWLWRQTQEDGAVISNEMLIPLRLKQITTCLDSFLAPGTKTTSSKIAAARSLVEDAVSSGLKVGVFTQFHAVVRQLARELAEFNPAIITDAVSAIGTNSKPSLRQQEVTRFQRDGACKVLIGTTGTCREGLTLTAGSLVIHLDKDWSPAYTTQIEDRFQRIGQTNPVQVVSLEAVITPDTAHPRGETVDSWIMAAQRGRRKVITRLLDTEEAPAPCSHTIF